MNIKSDFGIYDKYPDLVYFDSASTTLVPKISTSAMTTFLDTIVASARRGAHKLALRGSDAVESVRTSLAQFLATESSSISFQKSIPSAVASLVYGYNWKRNGKTKIAISQNEENSVLVAALRAAEVLDLDVEIIALEIDGSLSLNSLEQIVNDKTGIVAVGHILPGIGTKNPLREVEKIVHNHDALLLTDITRSIGVTKESLLDYGCDILLFSANIGLMGPPGLAIQWITPSLNLNHTPGILGGSSVSNVHAKTYEIAFGPDKFESGYINVPAIIGLGRSIEYLRSLHDKGLLDHLAGISRYMKKRLSEIDNLTLYGNYDDSCTIFGFNLSESSEVGCHDVALFLDEANIAVRSGLVCAHPLVQSITRNGLIQVSIHGYNSTSDIDYLADTLIIINEQLL
ncbi:aminotransferase class V-fold PLP-dependent enzyme [Candidatus Thorarchaeota archaeon]|nr:MAG: aminotransferase class V-fold PLP-dependent enzyme [Candidatus Thorarchaeota archaeon]